MVLRSPQLTQESPTPSPLSEDREGRVASQSQDMPSSFTPISSLPVEILYEILKASLDGGVSDALPLLERCSHSSQRWIPGRLFSYSQVCRVWRMVLLSSPDLWSSIFIGDGHLSLGVGILAGASAWLKRSGPLPLDVFIHLDTLDEDIAPDLARLLLDTFKDHAARMRKLSLRLPSRDLLTYSTISLLSNTPLLEDLNLCLPSSESSWSKIQCFSVPFAPKLSALRCIGWKAVITPTAPLYDLQEIRFDHFIPLSLAWNMIASAPNLEVVEMGLENDGRLADAPATVFRHLIKLDLRAREGFEDELNPFLDLLLVPNLEELSLSIFSLTTSPTLAPGSTGRLLAFLKASSFPHVRRLSLHNIGLSPSDARDIFNVLSGVSTLSLSGTSFGADILCLLSAHPPDPPHCDARRSLPLLKSLIVDVKGRNEAGIEALLDAICWRCSAGVLLDSDDGTLSIANLETLLWINCPRHVRSALEQNEKIVACRASGLALSFRSNHRE